jgi:hypothetical protein
MHAPHKEETTRLRRDQLGKLDSHDLKNAAAARCLAYS